MGRKHLLHSMPKRGIERVFLGSHEIKTWYPSPYPLDDESVDSPTSAHASASTYGAGDSSVLTKRGINIRRKRNPEHPGQITDDGPRNTSGKTQPTREGKGSDSSTDSSARPTPVPPSDSAAAAVDVRAEHGPSTVSQPMTSASAGTAELTSVARPPASVPHLPGALSGLPASNGTSSSSLAAPAALATPFGSTLHSSSIDTQSARVGVITTNDAQQQAVQAHPTLSTGRSLWVCDGCFKYARTHTGYRVHKKECTHTHPPGRKVYQRGAHIIWEVDGAVQKLYAQNLSLLGKLFIDHKAICFDVENFLFYVLTDASAQFDHPIGFFSKKLSYDDYNLACIITFPPFQKRSFGTLMIEFSYYLSAHDAVAGTPERPLSSLGFRGYLAFWCSVVLRALALAFDDTTADISSRLLAPPPSASSPQKVGSGPSRAYSAALRARQVRECSRIRRALLGLPEPKSHAGNALISTGDAEEDEMQRKWLLRISKGFGAAPKALPVLNAGSQKRGPGRRSSVRSASASVNVPPRGANSPEPARSVGGVKTEEDASETATSAHLDEPTPSTRGSRSHAAKQEQTESMEEDERIEAVIAAHPALQIRADVEGTGSGDVALVTTLERLASATRLRVDDVSFALAECGLLRFRVATPEVVALKPFGIDAEHPAEPQIRTASVKLEHAHGAEGNDPAQASHSIPFDAAAIARLDAHNSTSGQKSDRASLNAQKLGQPTPLLEPALLLTRQMVREAIKARNVKRPVLDEIYVLV
ncbi:acyl-CoA N-acyltransferase [Ceraceosorus guamensis]|uniref:histone acetyltransferase n=1 Tax=Ceraceosorus guamensis TaxID=1522189 RepID=A0A316VY79_9BASI|nr:acyl-CoA N-acyltransferase [Ceraceosorus guamensis]PWN42284.1 acyl-CoA N-acyltransferase [Ceraceosorus guamensis]